MNSTKHQFLLENLRAEILRGKYDSARSFPSVNAVVRRFDAKRSTVYGVLKELVREGLLSARQGRGFEITQQSCSRMIGLILPGLAYSEFFQPIASAFLRLAKEKEYTLLFGDVFSTVRAERFAEARELAASFVRKRIAGLIYQPLEYFSDGGETNKRILSVFNRAKIPVVLLDSDVVPSPARSIYDLVSINNVDAGEQLAEHLRACGAKNICFLMRPNWLPNVMNRYRGLKLAKNSWGEGDLRNNDVLLAEPDDVVAVRKCMRRNPRPDAFICENDTTAAVLRNSLDALGFSVPDDILLAGFDDLKIAQTATPRLTTIHQPCEELARVAFERLLARIATPTLPRQDIFLESSLVIRGSTERVASKRLRKSVRLGRGGRKGASA